MDVRELTQPETLIAQPYAEPHVQSAQQFSQSFPPIQQQQEQSRLSQVPLHPPQPLNPVPNADKPSAFRIELPLANINRGEYFEVEETPEQPHHLPAQRTDQNGYPDSQDLIGQSLDQRQQGEAAVDALEKYVRSIFSAVGKTLGMQSGYEHMVMITQDQEVAMTATAQHKMYGAIQKVIRSRCFEQVPIEHLMQIIKLSELPLKQAESLEVRVDESWNEDDIDSWVQQLAQVDTTLKAARTCLRIMSGGREDKQLYSETVISRSVDVFKTVVEDIVMPLVELRSSGSSSTLFKLLSKNKKPIASIFLCFQKVFALLADLVTKIELSDTVINSLEFTASRLIFVENAQYEKDSVVGIQKFDGIRSVAMDMLCQIFLIKPLQRQGIIDEILTSLEKLPVSEKSARQFKLSDGESIQPVSALIMRLVQASSGQVDNSKERSRSSMMKNINGEDNEDADADDLNKPNKRFVSSIRTGDQGAMQHAVAIRDLETSVAPLMDTASRNASYVINFMVKRAMTSTKTGDSPYRNLLELFVDDFTRCLDSPDWPSAELLLRLLMFMMVQLFEAPKTAAPIKNMALELLGGLSAAISRLRSQVKKLASSSEGNDMEDLSQGLADLAHHALEQKCRVEQIVAWVGPYRTTLEHLQNRSKDDPYLSNAMAFLVIDWASQVHNGYDSYQEGDDERDEELGRLAYRLRMMSEDRSWLANAYSFAAVSSSQAKLSYLIILLRSPLCESFNKILNILLGSMASDQATVRSKSLKSVNHMLETDPSILDGDSSVIQLILECASDSSPQVRDSALGLLGNCINMRPDLEVSLTPNIIDRFQDTGVGVRKRAMRLARDIYLRNQKQQLRTAIASGLLRRVQDPDEGVRDLARQMIEEVWFNPFYRDDNTAVYQTSLTEHVTLVIQTVRSGMISEILDRVFRSILKPKDKTLEGPFLVCSKLVANMFGLIDSPDPEDSTTPSGRDALQVLTIFAKADPNLFNFEQIRLLMPHLASFSSSEELAAFRAVTIIYQRVLPILSTVHKDFLFEVRKMLLRAIGRIPRAMADDLIAAVKVVCGLLNSYEPLANCVASALDAIQRARAQKLEGNKLTLFTTYTLVMGTVAKHCDLDEHIALFKKKDPKWKGDSVPRLLIDSLISFTSPSQPLEARKGALEAIGLVCQAHPRNYVVKNVYTMFQETFVEQESTLSMMILKSFKEFLFTEEKRSETGAEAPTTVKKKELTVMGGTTYDDVSSATTQRFLKHITRISLAAQDEHAFLAMEVLGSINRQGLVHPKETLVTLITLETSTNRKIAELAFSEHRSLHDKHETVLEREYTKAVQSAFVYQRDVVGDIRGATTNPFQSKLHFLVEVLKISKMKNRQRFLNKLCGLLDFDLAKLDVSEGVPYQMGLSRFIVENLAYFEYQTIGELQTTVNAIEKLVTGTGATVAQAIESELFNVRLDARQPAATQPTPTMASNIGMGDVSASMTCPDGQPAEASASSLKIEVDPKRFRQLTTASIILMSLWEARTYLRRLYGMGTNRHDTKAKAFAKDLNKAPVKVQGIHGDKFWDEESSHINGLDSQEMMVEKCSAFVELLNVDKEFKVADDGDEQMGLGDPATPSGEEDEDEEAMPDRGRKRKGGHTPGGRKKRARSNSQPRKRGRPRKNRESMEKSVEADAAADWI